MKNQNLIYFDRPFLKMSCYFLLLISRSSLFQVWQSSEDALLQMVVVVLVRLVAGNNTLPGWDDLGVGVQLLLVIKCFPF